MAPNETNQLQYVYTSLVKQSAILENVPKSACGVELTS